jgi:hypothetical protein
MVFGKYTMAQLIVPLVVPMQQTRRVPVLSMPTSIIIVPVLADPTFAKEYALPF